MVTVRWSHSIRIVDPPESRSSSRAEEIPERASNSWTGPLAGSYHQTTNIHWGWQTNRFWRQAGDALAQVLFIDVIAHVTWLHHKPIAWRVSHVTQTLAHTEAVPICVNSMMQCRCSLERKLPLLAMNWVCWTGAFVQSVSQSPLFL